MGQALYRKYRSKRLSDIVGQEHITHTLEQALKSGRISHAYLFTGPRGVGKTSIARILAHEINGLPYEDDRLDIDIIEIDAASNRRIEEIRDLRDKVSIAPTSSKYKVYIIDEVHMLTREAFNALLKTLEEPPAHVVFILATTEAHKLPETIISRTQRYVFRPIENDAAIKLLRDIAKKEKIDITDDALALIAEHSGGSLRDSTSLLDQAGGTGATVTVEAVQSMLGIPPKQAVDQLANLLQQSSSAADLITQLTLFYAQGFQAAAIAKQLAQNLRERIIAGQASTETTAILTKLLEVPVSHDPERYLEIVLLEAADSTRQVPVQAAKPAPVAIVKNEPAVREPIASPAPIPNPEPVAATEPVKQADKPTAKPAEPVRVKKPAAAGSLDETTWAEVINQLKKQYNTLYGVVRMAKPVFSDGKIELACAFAFHQKRLNEAKNKQIIADTIEVVTGQQVEIVCTVDDKLKAAKAVSKPEPLPDLPVPETIAAEPLSAISNIFGGGELLNS